MSALISTQELAERLGDTAFKVIDASWAMPAEKRDVKAEYRAGHIPGAVFFDIDAIADLTSPYPHMLPGADSFAQSVGALGIGMQDEIVVYDSSGLFSAARVWWMFRVFGHEQVRVLQGGLPEWKAENRPLETGSPVPAPRTFKALFHPSLVRSMAQIEVNCTTHASQVVDARSPGRFSGAEPEPRAGLQSGHIPHSQNLFFKDCLEPPFNRLKPAAELEELFSKNGIEIGKPVIATCGSGVTACILALALFELGNTAVPVYDGAWAEWGSLQSGSAEMRQ
jgi:thiosulfate/3-mercaptopyruvate sulfurtransferase